MSINDELNKLGVNMALGSPAYRVTDSGPDHDKTFTAVVAVDGFELGDGQGRSKKEAEQHAAAMAYAALRRAAATDEPEAAGADRVPRDVDVSGGT